MLRLSRGLRAVVFVVASFGLAGCPSLTTLHTARPVEVGKNEVGIALSTYTFEDGDSTDYLPSLEAQVRHGFGPRVDGGLRASSLSMLQVDLNYAVVLNDRFALSIDPTLAVLPIAGISMYQVLVPVLADVITSDRFTLTLSIKPGRVAVHDTDDDNDIGIEASSGLLGYGIGAKWRVNDSLTLFPEFAAVELLKYHETLYTLSVAVLF